ncbi:hypothetical protein OGAPHI_001281 [Ogataea philodendri]|uniref:C2H2-type domain-containing protein n=1 Tax=Ogataea philodendri TaxID=1378263 RepID=A0A9P8PFT9_9ASCO|nr:uncharacterized protein OGAPHI_001281 [Ogataea philodendri]KAH3670765.1 hypothetical protein OGAPHI_001281 [Ogataea philodendri]
MMSSSPPPNSQTPFKDQNVVISSSPMLTETLSLHAVNEYGLLHRPEELIVDHEHDHDHESSQNGSNGSINGVASYEMLDFVPLSSQEDPSLQYPAYLHPMTESYSSSTISSFNTDQPIPSSASTGSLTNVHRTPMRPTSTITPIKRSNSLITPRRPSNVAKASAVDKSPGTGNPFYTPPAFLSPKITKHRKQRSITASVSLSHLDTDLQLQIQNSHQGSPLHTPLRTPGNLGDEEEEDGETEDAGSQSYFISPSVLMKKKFGGKLSELQTLRHEPGHDHSSLTHMDPLTAANDFINPDFLQKVEDIPLLIDADNVESLDQQKLMHPPLVRASTQPPVHPKPGRLTRSRSSMNLSEIATYKEAKTAALRSANSFMDDLNYSISEVPESAPATHYNYELPFETQPAGRTSRFQYLTPPNSSSSSTPGVNSLLAKDKQKPPSAASTAGLKEPEHLDRPLQSSRSKSRSKNSDQDKKKTHECPLCHSRFQRPEHVKRHMRSHSSEKPFACPEEKCNKRFNRNDNLKQHLRKIHHLAV